MKAKIRTEILEKRKALSNEEVLKKSAVIIEKLKQTEEFRNASTIMFYVSYNNEVHTHELIKECFGTKRVVVPYIANDEIMIAEIEAFSELSPGAYNILEPKWIKPVLKSDIDLVIMPGAAFDKKGNRIGYGIGYYDMFLKGLDCPKIALGFDFQLVKKIPSEEHDVKVDRVITD